MNNFDDEYDFFDSADDSDNFTSEDANEYFSEPENEDAYLDSNWELQAERAWLGGTGF